MSAERLARIQARAAVSTSCEPGCEQFTCGEHNDIKYLLAKLAAVRELADAHGKVGFRVTANDIRATLDAEVNA